MRIYVKISPKNIQNFSIQEAIEYINTMAASDIDPFMIGYIPESREHFLFTLQYHELRRYGLRKQEIIHFFNAKTQYYPVPAYFIYHDMQQIFSITPQSGRFTKNAEFYIEPTQLFTPDEIENHCPRATELVVVKSAEAINNADSDEAIPTPSQAAILAIIQLLGNVFGIQTKTLDEEKILLRSLIASNGLLTFKKDLLLALDDYILTLSDHADIMHFSPQNQTAYNDLSAMYPNLNTAGNKQQLQRRLEMTKTFILYHDEIAKLQQAYYATTYENYVILIQYFTHDELLKFFIARKKNILNALTPMEMRTLISQFSSSVLVYFIQNLQEECQHFNEAQCEYLLTILNNLEGAKRTVFRSLPDSTRNNFIGYIMKKNKSAFYDLVSYASKEDIKQYFSQLDPIQFCDHIQSSADFQLLFQYFSEQNQERIFQHMHLRFAQLIHTRQDFLKIYFTLREKKQKDTFFESTLLVLSKMINTIPDFHHVTLIMNPNHIHQLLQKLELAFLQTLTTPSQFIKLIEPFSIILITKNRTFVMQRLAHWKTIQDYLSLRNSDLSVDQKKQVMDLLIQGRNESISARRENALFSAATGPSDLVALLSALDCIKETYTGKYQTLFTTIIDQIYREKLTFRNILTLIKEMGGVNTPDRCGRLNAALTELIRSIEHRLPIDIKHICQLAEQSFFKLICCTAD